MSTVIKEAFVFPFWSVKEKPLLWWNKAFNCKAVTWLKFHSASAPALKVGIKSKSDSSPPALTKAVLIPAPPSIPKENFLAGKGKAKSAKKTSARDFFIILPPLAYAK